MAKAKLKMQPRNKPRVEDTEAKGGASRKQSRGTIKSQVTPLDGEVIITSQIAETVPIAQFANVILGPTMLSWKLTGADMEKLVDVDWEDGTLTKEQQEVYDRVRGALVATSAIIEEHLSEDRETVERSVRQFNQRQEEEEKSAGKKKSK